jgi:peptidyl-prolyl cis-trans isomerase C
MNLAPLMTPYHSRFALIATFALSLAPACKGGETPADAPSSGGAPQAGSEKKDSRALANIGKETISVADFEDHITRQSPFVRRRFQDAEQRKKLLDDMVKREVMAQEAASKGYDKDAEVVQTMKKVMVQKLIREEFDKNFRNVEIPDAELQTYYDANKGDYHQPEMVRLSHIFIKAEAGKKPAAQKEARDLVKELQAKKNDYNAFREAAKKYSDAPDAATTGGDLSYLSLADLEAKVGKPAADAGFALKTVGDMTDALETPDGFHVLKLTGRRKEIDRSFDQVKNQIKNRMARDKRTQAYDEFVNGLMKKYEVKVDESLLAQVKVADDAPPEPVQIAPEGNQDADE